MMQLGLVVAVIGAPVLFLAAVGDWQRNLRLAQDPVVAATITKTWMEGGKGGGSFAALEFQRKDGSKTVSCNPARIRIGNMQERFYVGEMIKVAPRQHSCYEPDVLLDGRPHPGPRILIIYGCLVAMVGIILAVIGYYRGVAAHKSAT